jgi:AraC-like DNA-binding protein/mannose-6-phosphate isomerase-like protein (cupin superfamily)
VLSANVTHNQSGSSGYWMLGSVGQELSSLPRASQRERDRLPPPFALCRDFPAGTRSGVHSHRRSHLIFIVSGTAVASTEGGRWVIPQGRAIWIPGGIEHEVEMLSAVTILTVWTEPLADRDLSARCRVIGVSTLMLGLLMRATCASAQNERGNSSGMVMSLLCDELKRSPAAFPNLPFPHHRGLLLKCDAFLNQPRGNATIDEWCKVIGMSRRSFTRLFRKETGLSFLQWRQLACLFAALPRLSAGESIISVAIDLGYDSPAAFTTMFKRHMGAPPSQYLADGSTHSPG